MFYVSINNTLTYNRENSQIQFDDDKYSASVFVNLQKVFDTVDQNI